MDDELDRLARAYGLERRYAGIDGRIVEASDETLIALLEAFGVSAGDAGARRRALERAPAPAPSVAPAGARCFVPAFLAEGRGWGVTCQLYSLVSARNWGIGDFEDLACLAETFGPLGADFVGVNPLHAPFTAAPGRASPFSPSSRRFLNPLYIAVDRVPGFAPADADAACLARLRAAPLVDHAGVADAKLAALRAVFSRADWHDAELRAFAGAGGAPLRAHAIFEALSDAMTRAEYGAGWHGWPERYRDADSAAVADFAAAHADDVEFHVWLQWTADRQLGEAARRARAAGMRVGLYLDLAVGVAHDGSATWSDPSLSIVGAEVGAPPDMFNVAGQRWGLAAMAPAEIARRDLAPVRDAYRAILRHAGALRIDHAMSLSRLFLIPAGGPASAGAYARYPLADMLAAVAEASREAEAVIVGEDLGVVPEGFRDIMDGADMLGYRLFQFERDERGFRPPDAYPRNALACLGSHDTATFAGWWAGADIALRRRLGLQAPETAEADAAGRARDRAALGALLAAEGLAGLDGPDAAPAVGAHALVARTPSRLFAAQIEDLLGVVEQANLPGTVDEHPNWRRKLPVAVADLAGHELLLATVAAVAAERPRRP